MKFHVERSTSIKADLKKVKSLVDDFKQWNKWSPWTMVEPGCKMNYEGAMGEVGHKMSWDGEIIGSGTNTIEAVGANKIDYDLEFLSPNRSKAKTSFHFEEEGGEVKVTWTMDSSMPFFLFFMIPLMKAWIGMDYDRGLKMLKALAEKGEVNAKTTNEGSTSLDGFSYVGVQRTGSMDEIAQYMKEDFKKLMKALESKGVVAKHWVSLYPKFDMKNQMMTYIAACSDENLKDVDLGPDFVRGEIKSGQALEIKHKGSYEFLGNAWSMGMMVLRAKKMKQGGVPFEYYWNNPNDTQEFDLETSVYFPLK